MAQNFASQLFHVHHRNSENKSTSTAKHTSEEKIIISLVLSSFDGCFRCLCKNEIEANCKISTRCHAVVYSLIATSYRLRENVFDLIEIVSSLINQWSVFLIDDQQLCRSEWKCCGDSERQGRRHQCAFITVDTNIAAPQLMLPWNVRVNLHVHCFISYALSHQFQK